MAEEELQKLAEEVEVGNKEAEEQLAQHFWKKFYNIGIITGITSPFA